MTTFGALGGCAAPDIPHYPSTDTIPPEIDVHCHLFNIWDMPFYQLFVEVIITRDLVREIARPLARLIVSTAMARAPRAVDEIAELEGMRVLGVTNGLDDPARDPVQLFQAGVDAFLRDHIETPRALSAAFKGADDENVRFLNLLSSWYSPPRKTAPQFRDFSHSGHGQQFREEAHVVGQVMKAQADEVRTRSGPTAKSANLNLPDLVANFLMYWAPLYSKYRYRLASQLENFVGPPRPLRFVAPAILDVANWLPHDGYYDPGPPTPLAEQARLMELLSLVQPNGVALHGFIGFDPVQFIRDKEAGNDGLAVVKNAICSQGFVGVKVYPPMGFRAIGNAELDASHFPEHLRGIPQLGACLDAALLELYKFCVAYDVPIMAHCAYTVGPTDEAKVSAHPRYWQKLLDLPGFSSLRLNLAHAGGIWGFDNLKDCTVWTTYVGNMLASKRYPYLYADVGDVSEFLEGTRDPKTKRLVENMRGLPREAKARLMYGTDWSLLGRIPGSRKYRAAFESVMPKVLGPQDDLSGFFYRNAAAFLGLAPGTRIRDRLDNFYRKHGREPPTFLHAFSQPSPAMRRRDTPLALFTRQQ